jgi:hypothetical protein
MKVVARVLYGSQNYYLDGPDSDYDYKLLMLPEFEDFYNYHKVDKKDLPPYYDPEHYTVMSVLTFDKNLRNGNVNALELLFSRDFVVYEGLHLQQYLNVAYEAFYNGYLGVVWDEFLRTVEGMMKNSLERYDVNRKSASRAQFLLDFVVYVAEHNFMVDSTTWGSVCYRARDMRYDTSKTLPTKESFFEKFKEVKEYTAVLHKDFSVSKDWEQNMKDTMKALVFESLGGR